MGKKFPSKIVLDKNPIELIVFLRTLFGQSASLGKLFYFRKII